MQMIDITNYNILLFLTLILLATTGVTDPLIQTVTPMLGPELILSKTFVLHEPQSVEQ